MPDRSGITITCPSCLAQLQVEQGSEQTSIICYNCGDPCPVPAAAPPAKGPPPVMPPDDARPPAPPIPVTCATCLTIQFPPGDHGIFPCRHCGRLINTISSSQAEVPSSAGRPAVLPIPVSFQAPPRPGSARRVSPVERAIAYLFP